MNKWVRYLLWIVGMFIILWLGNRIIALTRMHADATALAGPEVWSLAVVPLVYGIYLSLLFVKRQSEVNIPMLILVSLPCVIFTIYVPISYQMHLVMYPWMAQANQITGIIAGLTLMISIFGGDLI